MDVDVSLCLFGVVVLCFPKQKEVDRTISKKEGAEALTRASKQEESANPPLSDFCPHASRAIVMMIFAKSCKLGWYDSDYGTDGMLR